jgi:hypothetical protein
LIKEKLNKLIDLKLYFNILQSNDNSNIETTPFMNVYTLLDDIGIKLEWPSLNVPQFQTASGESNLKNLKIEDRLTYLFGLKTNSDKKINIASLNKQISFYGIAAFFQKLIEFQCISKTLFSEMLTISNTSFKSAQSRHLDDMPKAEKRSSPVLPIEYAVFNLIYCLRLWQKFNQYKEFSVIVTKCISNSKLDVLSCYKSFISDYYTHYSTALSISQANQTLNWTRLNSLPLKQRLPLLANLFINETTANSYKVNINNKNFTS